MIKISSFVQRVLIVQSSIDKPNQGDVIFSKMPWIQTFSMLSLLATLLLGRCQNDGVAEGDISGVHLT